MNSQMRSIERLRAAGILAGSFTDIQNESAGTSAVVRSACPPAASAFGGAMSIRLWPGRAFAALIGALVVLLSIPLRNHFRDPMRNLALASRPFEARVIGLAYAPLSVKRGSGETDAVNDVLTDLDVALRKERTPENLHRFATALLASGDAARARKLLEEASAATPDDLAILSDLATAELADERVFDAAEHSGFVLERDPMYAPAAFTWGVSMERLFNKPAAIDAWRRYLIIDAESAWADEARTRLAALQQPRVTWLEERTQLDAGASRETIRRLVAKYPQLTRVRVINKLLPRWCATGDPALFAAMQAMAEERAPYDPFLLDVITHARDRRLEIKAGVEAWDAAMAAASDVAAAAKHFTTAAQEFERAGSPLAWNAWIYAASSEQNTGPAATVLSRLDVIDARLGDRYPSLTSDSLMTRGLVLARGRSLSMGLRAWRDGLAAARRSGEIEVQQQLQQLIAAALEASVDRGEADAERLRALELFDSYVGHPGYLADCYADASFGAQRAGRAYVARAFARAYAAVAAQSNDLVRGAYSDLRRGLAILDIGHLDAASHAIASARMRALAMPVGGYREPLLAETDYAAGVIAHREKRFDAAIDSFTSAIRTWERFDWHLHSAGGYFARAEANRTRGDVRNAEADYRAAVAEMEAQRSGFEPQQQVAYFERAEVAFERLIDLLVTQGRTNDALSIAERKRARALLDRIGGSEPATPLDANQIQAHVPADAALLHIAVLENATDLWLVRQGKIQHVRRDVPRIEIERAVTRHLDAIDRGDEAATKREGRWLYDQFVAPVIGELPSDATLVIVPDGALHTCPFPALVAEDGRWLVERFSLASAPSASVLFRQLPPRPRDSMFAVAEPAPHGMQRLSAVTSEAEDIARAYPSGIFMHGAAITPNEFLQRAGASSWVHFGGHARTDVEHPALSSLMFESTDASAEELTAATIGASRLPSAPFVVLAACSTGRGKLRRNEGTQSLAAAFLQAGARGVVATLWDVDDASSAKLFRAFHQNLREGARPADALRAAQRALLRSPDPRLRAPSVWASAVLDGTI